MLIVAAIAYRLWIAQLDAATLRTLAVVVLLAIPYSGAAVVLRSSRRGSAAPTQLFLTAANLVVVSSFMAAAAKALPDLPAIAFPILCAIVITTGSKAHRVQTLAIGGLVYLGLIFSWSRVPVTTVLAPAETVPVWGALMVAFLLLLHQTWVETESGISGKMAMLDATADAAQRLGLANDESSVATAILRACASAYPHAESAELWVVTEEGRLRMVRAPITAPPGDPPEIVLDRGQSYPGMVFESGDPYVWEDVRETPIAAMPRGTIPALAARDSHVRSAVATPLRLPNKGTIGVLALYSRRRNMFDRDDLVVVQGLANQATLGLERSRLYQEQLTHATTDPLTELANRRAFELTLRAEVSRGQRNRGRLAVLFCDLDNFKAFNDRLGHAVGDRVLALFADTLRANLRAEDTAARLGGDEFVCLLPGADKELARLVAERVSERFALAQERDSNFGDVRTGVTMGWAAYPTDSQTAESLLQKADAMLLARKDEKDNTDGAATIVPSAPVRADASAAAAKPVRRRSDRPLAEEGARPPARAATKRKPKG